MQIEKIPSNDTLPTPFLKEVADCFVANEPETLAEICFVTPNKRSGIFLARSFADAMAEAGMSGFLPEIVPITDFIAELGNGVEASRIEQLMILYNAYSEVVHRHATPEEINDGRDLVDFNRFQYWGDVLLSDFNDVDRFMVDARMLFKNVENLKEISANFLTPEQIEVIKRYWNEELVPEPVKEFWRHTVHTAEKKPKDGENSEEEESTKKNVAGFLRLWQVMFEVYELFRQRMEELGYTYTGKLYRDVAEAITQYEAEHFRFGKYVFVGFNVLSKAERTIFEALQKLEIADFYWDFASPVFRFIGNRASKFMKGNLADFPSHYSGIGTTKLDYFPKVKILGLPSTIGQAKIISDLVKEVHPELFDSDYLARLDKVTYEKVLSSAVDTALVLPDENLIHPILTAMSTQIESVNVTMGFSLRHTSVATLMRSIVSLQLRARDKGADDTFFWEDVKAVLSHPLVRMKYEDVCDDIMLYVNRSRLFNIPVKELEREEFAPLRPIFKVVHNATEPEAVLDYLTELLMWLRKVLLSYGAKKRTSKRDASIDSDDYAIPDFVNVISREEREENAGVPELDLQYVDAYLASLDELRLLSNRYLKSLFLEDKTIFHLVERIVGNQTVNYDGIPLAGLQAMGLLETRCLDFKNLVITSANERILPRKHYAKSFIPNALRRGYGMSTIDHQESMYAYYFYRLLSRAETVYLLYDARTTGVRSGGPSRFINQIRYQFPREKVTQIILNYPVIKPATPEISIPKSPEVMRKLRQFTDPDELEKHYLSAHSINTYLGCQLQFYLENIEGFYAEEEVVDYMQDTVYGSIVHDAVQKMFDDAKGDAEELELTDALLAKLSNDELISRYVAAEIRRTFLKLPPDHPEPLYGQSALYCRIMTIVIKRMLKRELELEKPRWYVAGELGRKTRLPVSAERSINFYYRIDRVDRFEKDGETIYRLIDYKTGGDPINGTMDAIFKKEDPHRPKALLQLMLYANAFAYDEKCEGKVQPYLYNLRRVSTDAFTPLVIKIRKEDKNPLEDFRDVNDTFLDRLNQLFDELLDPDVPFVGHPDRQKCKFCQFKEFCGVDLGDKLS